jgi:hypothetical protein
VENKGFIRVQTANPMLIQWDTIYSDCILTCTTYSSSVAIPEAVNAAAFRGKPGKEARDLASGACKHRTTPLAEVTWRHPETSTSGG